jgi:uncharacterized surface protein with fasciclin (FAS1) repeats
LPVILPVHQSIKMSNITQVVRTEKNMTTLKKGIIATNLDQVLSSTGPYTFFAPSDLAFEKLDHGIMEDLLMRENKAKLTDLLNLHVVAGKIPFKDFKDGEKLKTLHGKELSIQVKDNKVTIDGAAIQNKEMQTSNGVIHSLDTVLKN